MDVAHGEHCFKSVHGTAMTPSRTLTGSLACPASSANPSRTDVPLHVQVGAHVGAHVKPWALLGHDPGYARACAYGLPPIATVDDLIEAESPLVLLVRELPELVPRFSVAALGQWIVFRHPRRHPD